MPKPLQQDVQVKAVYTAYDEGKWVSARCKTCSALLTRANALDSGVCPSCTEGSSPSSHHQPRDEDFCGVTGDPVDTCGCGDCAEGCEFDQPDDDY
jgi:hypothetical protein